MSKCLQNLPSLNEVLEQSSLGIIILSSNWEIVTWNNWVERHSNILSDQAIGKTLTNIFPAIKNSRLYFAIENSLSNGSTSFLTHTLNPRMLPLYKILPEHGKELHCAHSISVRSITNESTNDNWSVIEIQDVSATVSREKSLLESKNAAVEAEELKQRTLSFLSHELRTPMNAVVMISSLLSNSDISDDLKQVTKLLKDSGENIIELMNNILDIAKLEEGRTEITKSSEDVNGLVSEVADLMKIHCDQKALDLIVECDPKIKQSALIDKVKVKQVLMNLIMNAIKFTNEGHIKLSTILTKENDIQYIEISVKDTGIGISADHQKQIFEKFFQIKDTKSKNKTIGSGLGLSICSSLIELCHGFIRVESKLGEGSDFKIYLPYVNDEEIKQVK